MGEELSYSRVVDEEGVFAVRDLEASEGTGPFRRDPYVHEEGDVVPVERLER